MNVRKIINAKGTEIVTVRPDLPISAFASIVIDQSVGAAPVTDDKGNLLGVVSERDIVRGFNQHGTELAEKTVGELMTVEVVCCSPENSISDVAELMQKHGIRHIAVLDHGALAGFVSIRDVAFNRLTELELNNETLRELFDHKRAVG
jgi:CBS domain-containing protein